jgi:ABC-type branched-subunit amino acid transport system substrate-binding protein
MQIRTVRNAEPGHRFVNSTPSPRLQITRRRVWRALAAGAVLSLAGCGGGGGWLSGGGSWFGSEPAPAPQKPAQVGAGQVKVGLILPLSAPGSPGVAAQSMRSAAELALSEFNAPNIQLLIKDDGGTAGGAQQAAQAALTEGAEIILGPLLGQPVAAAGQIARARNVPVIGFSSDSSVAAHGVYLLSFLPESDVDRIVGYAAAHGKRSFAALIPEGPYGNVVDQAFRQAIARTGGRIVAEERYSADPARMAQAVARVAPAFPQADSLFLPGEPETVNPLAQALANAALPKRIQLLGTGPWEDTRIYTDSTLQGGWFPMPEGGYKAFAARYRKRFNQDPVRTATLAYDAVSLVAALVKTQGPQRFADSVLTNPSGFSGIDGIFRFRPDGGNDRGLAVVRVTPSGPQTISPPPRSFPGQT